MPFSAWDEFVGTLATEVDWSDSDYIGRQAVIVEQILHEAAVVPEMIQERVDRILADDDLFTSLAPHMNYPRILMDKFILYMDPQVDFRIRLHRFKTRRQNGGAVEKVHYHKWDCSTVMLRGSYRERQFSIAKIDEQLEFAQLDLDFEHVLNSGCTNSLPAGRPHQVINDSETEPCITLFIRGSSILPEARIFDVQRQSFYNTYGPEQQLRVGLAHMGRLDPEFH